MSNYTVYYSDPSKYANPITVLDGTVNNQSTSISLLGQNYNGSYGGILATDLVHMLENFANANSPNNPIEGQLWFDNSDPNNKVLRINDGGANTVNWRPVGGIWQQATDPQITGQVIEGDIWVDTAGQQLSIFNGNGAWTLIGPNYSSATRTGSYPTAIYDIENNLHNIIINYVNDTAVEITATESFTPNPVISGFENGILAGVNVSQNTIINGTANLATNLQCNLPYPQTVAADTFLRKDIPQTVNSPLTINSDNNALSIGSGTPTFILQRPADKTYQANFLNAYPNNDNAGQFNFNFYNSGANNTVLTIQGNSNRVGINVLTPKATLDITGDVRASSSGTFDTIQINSTIGNTNTVASNALVVNGGAGVGGTLIVTGEHILNGTLTIGTDIVNILSPDQAAILPYVGGSTPTGFYDIGSPSKYWRNVYANTFGTSTQFTSFYGNLYGSAQQLRNTLIFTVQGDVITSSTSTNGYNVTTPTLNVTIAPSAFTNKTIAPVVPGSIATVSVNTTATDTLLIYRPDNGNVYQQSKAAFLKDINYIPVTSTNPSPGSLVPTGTVIPFAGLVSKIPTGWLLCDGSQYSSGTPAYANLYSIISTTYGGSGGNFNVPNIAPLTTGTHYIIKT